MISGFYTKFYMVPMKDLSGSEEATRQMETPLYKMTDINDYLRCLESEADFYRLFASEWHEIHFDEVERPASLRICDFPASRIRQAKKAIRDMRTEAKKLKKRQDRWLHVGYPARFRSLYQLQHGEPFIQSRHASLGEHALPPEDWCGALSIICFDKDGKPTRTAKATIYSLNAISLTGNALNYSWVADFETKKDAEHWREILERSYDYMLMFRSVRYLMLQLSKFVPYNLHPDLKRAAWNHAEELKRRLNNSIECRYTANRFNEFINHQNWNYLHDAHTLKDLYDMYQWLLIENADKLWETTDTSLLSDPSLAQPLTPDFEFFHK